MSGSGSGSGKRVGRDADAAPRLDSTNRLLALPGARVTDVSFTEDGVVCEVALRRRRAACSSCGQVCRSIHDRSPRRWRHLDLAGQRLQIEYALRRVRCTDCGVHVEAVPWARPRARHTRDFEDLTAFLAQQMAKTPIARLLRVRWDTVGRIVERVVADHLDARRLEGLLQIGVDEIAYRRGQRYLTTVADHRSGAIIWMRPGRNAQTLQAFFTELGERSGATRGQVDPRCERQRERAVEARVHVDQLSVPAVPDELKLGESGITYFGEKSGAAGHEVLVRRHADSEAARPCLGRPGSARLLLEAADHPSCPIEHERHCSERPGRALLNEKRLVRRHPDEPSAELALGANRPGAPQGAARPGRLQHERG